MIGFGPGDEHLIAQSRHHLSIDRQLFGRCARQGDPGSCEAMVSLEDEIFAVHVPGAARWAAAFRQNGRAARAAQETLRSLAQRAAERRGAAVRVQNLKLDQRLEQMLAFSGRGE